MSYRFMRVIVFFDLPTLTSEDKRQYRKFRKFLLKKGFVMMQESVYSKIALNGSVAESIERNLKKNKPSKGIVQLLIVTERQFSKMEYLVGAKQTKIIDSDERLIVI